MAGPYHAFRSGIGNTSALTLLQTINTKSARKPLAVLELNVWHLIQHLPTRSADNVHAQAAFEGKHHRQ